MSVGVYGVYALTNAWFVARGVGLSAMAAVNLVAPILLALGAVSTTVGVGGASLVSRSLGSGDPAMAARGAGNAFTLFWASAVTTTVVGLVFLDPLLEALGATGEARPLARAYAVVLLAGAIFSTGFSSLVRAEGRARFATMLWVVPVLVQITLDPLLIYWLHLGVRGAALGTVGGQAVSAAMSLWFFFIQRDRPYRITASSLRPHLPTVRALLSIGGPSFLFGIGATVLAAIVNSSLSRTGGATALAAYAVCARIQTFAVMPYLGLSQGLQPIVGYNAGRQLHERVLTAKTLALRAAVLYGAAVLIVAYLLAKPLVNVFIDDPEASATGAQALRIIAIGISAGGVAPLASAYFQALGRPRPSYVISLGTLVAFKVPLVLAFGRSGPTGTWVALALGDVLAALAAAMVLLVTTKWSRLSMT